MTGRRLWLWYCGPVCLDALDSHATLDAEDEFAHALSEGLSLYWRCNRKQVKMDIPMAGEITRLEIRIRYQI